jgi:tripartite-type tricarboxylate transporter receptor subunit TctC
MSTPIPRWLLRSRRALLAGAAACTCALVAAQETNYPTAPIRIVVPYPAGGGTDTVARTLASKLQESWGQTVIVDNKPGASGVIGNDFVAKAPADGYTVLLAITAIVQLPAMKKLPYDVMTDLRPIAQAASTNSAFVVPASTQAASLKEFIALAKANKGKANYGSYGVGTSSHIQGSLLNLQSGSELTHVPYKGAAPLLQDLKGGQLMSAFIDMATLRPHIDSFKVLAVTGVQRNRVLPNVPTFAELGYHSFEPVGWFGFFMPAAVPAPIAKKFGSEIERILKLPDVAARIEGLGMVPGNVAGDDFGRLVRADAQVYAKIIKDANITLD